MCTIAFTSLLYALYAWRHQMEIFSALLAPCAGNSPVSGEFPSQRPVMRIFDVFYDLRVTNRLSKQSRGWWLETPSCSLWRHCNGIRYLLYITRYSKGHGDKNDRIVAALFKYNITAFAQSNGIKFMGPTWVPPWSCRLQMGPMLAPWTLLSRMPWCIQVRHVPSITHCGLLTPSAT